MKTRKSSAQWFATLSIFLFAVVILSACHKDNESKNTNGTRVFTISGSASASQVVPAATDSGTASISGTFSESTGKLITTTSWSNLTGGPTAGGFYNGAAGSNGTLVGSAWALGTGLNGAGSFTDTLTLTNDQAAQLTNGNWYYTLSTLANPNGEVRGQIVATAD
jgi:hypothetical protein